MVAGGDMEACCIGEAAAEVHVKPSCIDAKAPTGGINGRRKVTGDRLGDTRKNVKFT